LKQEVTLVDYQYSILNYIKKISSMDIENRLHELENNLSEENMEE